jgi:exodeoxyribonuclease VII large subunit
MLQVLGRRNRGIDVIITPVKVQGAGAAREIVDAIRLLNKHAKKPGNEIDVIIVGRGGGSIEDLWAFNEEPVARAIYESEIPVVSAVGHETDYTIADFVADYRAPTPSAAAEIVAAESSDLAARIEYLQNSLARAMNHNLLMRKSHLRDLIESRGFAETAQTILSLSARCRELERRAADALRARLRGSGSKFQDANRRLESTDFRALITIKSGRLDALDQRLSRAAQRRLEAKRHNLAVAASKLDMLSPLAVLGRGYALVKDEAGNLISRAAMVGTGQKLALRFEDGEIGCRAD